MHVREVTETFYWIAFDNYIAESNVANGCCRATANGFQVAENALGGYRDMLKSDSCQCHTDLRRAKHGIGEVVRGCEEKCLIGRESILHSEIRKSAAGLISSCWRSHMTAMHRESWLEQVACRCEKNQGAAPARPDTTGRG